MENSILAAFWESLTAAATRRGVLAGLGGEFFAVGPLGIGGNDAEASKRGKRRQRRKRKKQRHRPVTRADATCGGPSDTNLGAPSGQARVAQTFTAISSGPLISVQILINKLSGAAAGDFVLRLSPVAESGEVFAPTDDVLAETSVADDAVPEGESPVTFTFASPFSVVSGTQYALVLTRPGGGQFAWSGHGESCPGQSFASVNQTGGFIDASPDLIFTAFVRS